LPVNGCNLIISANLESVSFSFFLIDILVRYALYF
jgi:hypothetical protein